MAKKIVEETDLLESPLHGNQGDRQPTTPLHAPLGTTIAISREAGSRGGSIARRVGKRLGWQIYTQELLEYIHANETARAHVLADIPEEAASWADNHLETLRSEKIIDPQLDLGEMPRLVLTLAARGNIVILGRGGGFLLPRSSTLHVRIVAPFEDRVAYLANWLRLTHEEAIRQVHDRDLKRADYLSQFIKSDPGDMCHYDLVLNSFQLGEETCADLIVNASQGKDRFQLANVE